MMHILLPILTILSYSSLAATNSYSPNILTQGSSLSVEKQTILVSPNRIFTAGFHQIGQNAYFFAIWFTDPLSDNNHTIIWIANREEPVNGKESKFSLDKNGNLVLTDAKRQIWTTDIESDSPLQLQLLDTGNLVLTHLDKNSSYLWESFNFPTDTILPNQLFTKNTVLISSKSLTDFSLGFYKLYFDNDNVLRLVYTSDEVTSVYWPNPWQLAWEVGRTTYNNSRIALLDTEGRFTSTDDFTFITSDYGSTLQRKLTLDVDGNIRVYTLNERKWIVTWQAISFTCRIHGTCGLNSLCTYNSKMGRRSCSCMKGYKPKNESDMSFGCEPTFNFNKGIDNYDFIKLPSVAFYGFDSLYLKNSTLKECQKACLDDPNCKAVQYTFDNFFECYTKRLLFSGVYKGDRRESYLKLPKTEALLYDRKVVKESRLNCTSSTVVLKRTYAKKSENGSIKFMLWFSIVLGAIEAACFILFYYITKQPSGATIQSYLAIATGFRRFTYDEIMKASHKFRDEVGRGGSGVVYKGVLPDNRVVAIKVLHEAIQGEGEFLAELNTIGRINHKNLIETYGYCAEGKHRILVFEYMENGSLAGKLGGNELDWTKVLKITTGVAKGLAYLHEECLEWVLHCDVKPHNILLDVEYNPKVADFGLSKLFQQDVRDNNSVFSRIRGTRGYMAPEWVFNLPITSKVDVYSYGMVVLEMITGRSATCDTTSDGNEGVVDQKRLVSWVREKLEEGSVDVKMMEIVNPMMGNEYDKVQMKNLLKVALQCVEEDKDARPTMSEVVNVLRNSHMDD